MTHWLKEKRRFQKYFRNLKSGVEKLKAQGFQADLHYYFADGQYQLEVLGPGKKGKAGVGGFGAVWVVPDDFSSPTAAEGNYAGTEYRPERRFGKPTERTVDAFVRWVVEHAKRGARAPSG